MRKEYIYLPLAAHCTSAGLYRPTRRVFAECKTTLRLSAYLNHHPMGRYAEIKRTPASPHHTTQAGEMSSPHPIPILHIRGSHLPSGGPPQCPSRRGRAPRVRATSLHRAVRCGDARGRACVPCAAAAHACEDARRARRPPQWGRDSESDGHHGGATRVGRLRVATLGALRLRAAVPGLRRSGSCMRAPIESGWGSAGQGVAVRECATALLGVEGHTLDVPWVWKDAGCVETSNRLVIRGKNIPDTVFLYLLS